MNTALTVNDIAARVGGRVEGDGSAVITGMAGLREARPGDVSFLANARYADAMAGTQASAVIVDETWQGTCGAALVRVGTPDRAFAETAVLLGPAPVKREPGVHPAAVLAGDVELGIDVFVGPCCVLEPGVRVGARTVLEAGVYLGHGVSIGEDGHVYPHVSMREGTRVGDRVTIHNGAVIGSDGFGYVRNGEAWEKVPQLGRVEIGDDVEIGANVTIDRARFGRTVIERGVKIDNLVQVAHNCRIGEHSALAAQTGISGSTTIGRSVQVGGQSGFAGHLHVGDRCVFAAKTGVTKDVASGSFMAGFPAREHNEWRKQEAMARRLPALRERVRDLGARIEALEARLGEQPS